ncbi:hypothetical protein NECAME_00530 [Necator americanus]|uniref:Uncharacterized protein n=1 Tax=Necator americanus TaxID=51031 RepID=W2T5V7_NECAM|nr:hypothetical protein NECAME_00530 [Necator americanus]ETN77004.1 hypothetical protein NECAME_00530 [Necator americanus]
MRQKNATFSSPHQPTSIKRICVYRGLNKQKRMRIEL